MKDLTIIIPVHEYSDNGAAMFKRAFGSVINMYDNNGTVIMVVGPSEVIEKYKTLVEKDNHKKCVLKFLANENSNMFEQINKGVENAETEYVSILEYDDTFKPKWLKNVSIYKTFYGDVSTFMPITELVNTKGEALAHINEIAWANSFSNELGYIDIDSLEAYLDFNVTGSVIKREDFLSVGGLKPSLKIAAWCEFLMRMCYNGKKIMVIPKVGYCHTINRPDSYIETQKELISDDEGQWLVNMAKQEYYFKEDRKKSFQK